MINLELKKSCSKISLHPFNYAEWSLVSISKVMIVLLSLNVVLLFATKSFESIAVIASSLAACVISDFLHRFVFSGKKIRSMNVSIIQGLLIGLLLPQTYPCVAVFIVVFLTMLVFTWAFGEYSESWANSVAVCVIILYFLNSSFFPKSALSVSELQSRNSALVLIQNGTVSQIKFDPTITEFLNRTVFKFFGISIPDGYVSLFWDNGSLIPAFRFNVLTILSSLILLSFDFVDMLIPTLFLVVYGILVRFVSPIIIGGVPMQGDLILAFLTSGILFSTLYLLQWFGTTPTTLWGKLIYGFTSGVIGFLIIGYGVSSSGYVFTVLVMNILSPCIQIIEDKRIFKRIRRRVLPLVRKVKEYENA